MDSASHQLHTPSRYSHLAAWIRVGPPILRGALLGGAIFLGACADDQASESGSGREGESPTTGAEDPIDTSTTTGDGATPKVCTSPNHHCDGPAKIDPAGLAHGDLFSPFDAGGCLRASCGSDLDCGAGEACFTPARFGGCTGSSLACEPMAEGCICGGASDCEGSYCVAEALVPEFLPDANFCDRYTTREACTAAPRIPYDTTHEYHCGWVEARRVRATADGCEALDTVSRCVTGSINRFGGAAGCPTNECDVAGHKFDRAHARISPDDPGLVEVISANYCGAEGKLTGDWIDCRDERFGACVCDCPW